MTGVESFVIRNKSPNVLEINAMGAKTILSPDVSSRRFMAPGNYAVNVVDPRSVVFNVDFSGPGGSLNITPGSHPDYAEVVPNYA